MLLNIPQTKALVDTPALGWSYVQSQRTTPSLKDTTTLPNNPLLTGFPSKVFMKKKSVLLRRKSLFGVGYNGRLGCTPTNLQSFLSPSLTIMIFANERSFK